MRESDKRTIIAYADNDMNMLQTAYSMQMSVGGVKYRLEQIAKRSKYDPFKFYDLIELLRKAGKTI